MSAVAVEPGAVSLGWDDALTQFDAYMRRGKLRQTTRKSHRAWIRRLAEHVPDGPAAVTGGDVAGWLAGIESGASRRNAWQTARTFYGWARWAGVVDESPVPAGSQGGGRRASERVDGFPAAWVEPVRAYVRELEAAGRARRSIDVAVSYLRQVARVCREPWAVTREDVAGWLGSHDWKPETRKSARGSVARFYAWAAATGRVEVSPCEGLARVKVPRGVPRPAPAAAVSGAMVEASDRDALMLLLGTLAGLRAAEIAAVRPSTDLTDDGWLYVTGKGGHTRRVPVHPVLASAIEDELSRRRTTGYTGSGWRPRQADPGGYLFPGRDGGHMTPGAVTSILTRMLPPGVTAHTLRHRFASEVYASCLDLRAVQELLGHASPTTTARYTAVPAGQLVAAVRGIR